MIPYLAIGYFAGLRTVNELARLDWREIDLADNTITVSPATANKRRSRYVTIAANLAAWILPHRETEGGIWEHQTGDIGQRDSTSAGRRVTHGPTA